MQPCFLVQAITKMKQAALAAAGAAAVAAAGAAAAASVGAADTFCLLLFMGGK